MLVVVEQHGVASDADASERQLTRMSVTFLGFAAALEIRARHARALAALLEKATAGLPTGS